MRGTKRLTAIASICLAWGLVPAAPGEPPAARETPPAEAPAPSDVPVPPGQGDPAPLFAVPDLEGRPLDVQGLVQGKPALLVFWASWCQPCIEEIPQLRDLARTYRNRGFVVLGVGVREGGETPEKQRRTAARQLVNYHLVYDEQGTFQKAWALEGVPWNVLLDAEGRVAWQGNILPYDLDERVRELIVKARRGEGTPQG